MASSSSHNTGGHEVLTIQAGGYSNYVGSHFWNLSRLDGEMDGASSSTTHHHQHRYNPPRSGAVGPGYACMYRTGQTETGQETFTPRLLAFDTMEGMGRLRPGGYLYHQEAYDVDKAKGSLPWSGPIEVHRMEAPPRPPEDNEEEAVGMEEDDEEDFPVSFWSDYLRVDYHPRSVVPLNPLVVEGRDREEEDEDQDRLRQFLEECDAPQGLHTLIDMDPLYLPLATSLVQTFHDECRGAGMVCFLYDLQRQGTKHQEEACLVTTALHLKHLLDAEALVLPLAAAEVGPTPTTSSSQLYYQTAAVQAAAIDTATHGYRDGHTSPLHMQDWVRGVRGEVSGLMPLASLEVTLPFPPISSRHSLDELLQPSNPSTAYLSPQPTGLLSLLHPLYPLHGRPPSSRLERHTSVVALRGLRGIDRTSVLESVNDALKYYPWFTPHLNTTMPYGLELQHKPFPKAIRKRLHGEAASMMTCIGSTSGVLPFLTTVVGGLIRRSPSMRAYLSREGLIDEDVRDIEEALLSLVSVWEAGKDEDILVHWKKSKGSVHGARSLEEDEGEDDRTAL